MVDVDYIRRLYLEENLSDDKIGKIVGVSRSSVRNIRLKYGISSRTISESNLIRWKKIENITKNEIDIINGLLLGDGYLHESKFSARYQQSCKYSNVLKQINHLLPNVAISIKQKIRKDRIDKFKGFIRGGNFWVLESLHYRTLLPLRKKWYINNYKVIPNDLVLNPISCYWWYICDGSVGGNQVSLCTNGFSTNDTKFLCELLNKTLEISSSINSRNMIILSGSDTKKWFNYIGPCKTNDYSYKWNVYVPGYTFKHTKNWESTKKLCNGCNKMKPRTINFFYKNKGTKDNLMSRCKECELKRK